MTDASTGSERAVNVPVIITLLLVILAILVSALSNSHPHGSSFQPPEKSTDRQVNQQDQLAAEKKAAAWEAECKKEVDEAMLPPDAKVVAENKRQAAINGNPVDFGGFKVSFIKAVAEKYGRYVTGVVTNNTDHAYRYVQVEINEYDKSLAVVGSTFANVDNLEAGEKWKFKALISEESATNFDIKNVTGW